MARIKTYVNDDNISEYDVLIGSDAESLNGTKNYSMASIINFVKAGFGPENGGNLSLRELSYTGSAYTTPHAYLNSLNPYITILQYDVVIVNINGTKYLLKKQDVTVGFQQVPLLSSDFILIKEPQVNSDWNSTSGPSQILNKPSTQSPQVNSDWNSTSGVSQILNKPTIPSAQVNSDWSSTSGISQILNKPSIPSAQVNSDWNSTSGVSQILNKPSIPSAQVNSDWNSTSGISQILNKPTLDGSETKINNGTNVTITGTGTIANPYVINSSASSPPVDGSETKINSTGTNVTVTGTGTIANPYIINSSASSNNLQRTVSSAFTLSNSDNNYTIILNNGSSSFSITVPTGLASNFNVGFIQQGTGVVDFLAQGTTINTPSGLKIKGANYNAYLEKVGSTEVYQLFGNLIV